MNLSELAIKRPKSFVMIFVLMLILGTYAFNQIPKEKLPDVSYPKITVRAFWGNQSPENIVRFITSIIEEDIYTVKGVKKITSTTRQGSAYIEIELERDADINFTVFLVNERVSSLKSKLPADMSPPRVEPYVPYDIGDATFFSFYLFSAAQEGGGAFDRYYLTRFAEQTLKRELSGIPGVADVVIQGGVTKELRIVYRAEAIEQYNVSFNDLILRLNNLNKKQVIGHLEDQGMRRYVTFVNDVDPSQIKNWDIGNKIQLGQVADISFVNEDPVDGIHKIDGHAAVYVVLAKSRNANALSVSKAVKEKLQEILDNQSVFGYTVADDEGKDIVKDYRHLAVQISVAVAAIFLVLFAFMRNIRSSLITMMSIFLSASIALNFLFFSKESLNMFTMSGLALAFGLLVDNAVVEYESIHKLYYKGMSIKNAIITTYREMFMPILASTLTTICVLIPFVFLQDDLKIYYIPFAKTVCVSLIVSILVSFTLIPIAFLRFHIEERKRERTSRLKMVYEKYIRFIFRFRYFVLFLILFIVGHSIYTFVTKVDRSSFTFGGGEYDPWITCFFYTEANVPDFRLKDEVTLFEGLIAGNETVDYYRTSISSYSARILVYFKEPFVRSAEAYSLREKLKIYGARKSQVSVRVSGIGPDFGGGFMGGTRYASTIYLQGYNYEKLKEFAEYQFKPAFEQFREVSNVKLGADNTDAIKKVVVRFDSEKLRVYNLDVFTVIRKISVLLRDYIQRDSIKYGNDNISFALRLEEKLSLYRLRTLHIRSGIKLGDIADILFEETNRVIRRDDQNYRYPISYEYSGQQVSQQDFEKNLNSSIAFPPGFSVVEQERFFGFGEEIDYTRIIGLLIMAIIIIYMILAALYENLLEPLIILISLPLAFVGVVWFYKIFELTFTVHAIMGSMLLAGIVVNNAIIMINHINHLRTDSDYSRVRAIISGASDRVRPILITSLTTIVGLLPIILIKNESDATANTNIWKHLSYATVGGLTTSTLFTLTFMPLFYLFFAKRDVDEPAYRDSGVWHFIRGGGPVRVGKKIYLFGKKVTSMTYARIRRHREE